MGGECCGVQKILEIDPGCCSTEAATTTMMSRTTSRMALQRISRVARGARRTNQSPRAAAAAAAGELRSTGDVVGLTASPLHDRYTSERCISDK